MKSVVLLFPLFLALLASATTEPGTYVRAVDAQTSGCETTPQLLRSQP